MERITSVSANKPPKNKFSFLRAPRRDDDHSDRNKQSRDLDLPECVGQF